MSLAAVGLVLGSSILHALWNLLLKQARDKTAFTALYLSVAPVVYLPMFLAFIGAAEIPPAGWLCILGTGVVYAGYFIGIARAYETGELSVAYPLMRSLGPALAFIGGILFLSERPSTAGAVGVALVLGGGVALYGASGRGGLNNGSENRRVASALPAILFVGWMYSLYSLIDKVGVGYLQIHPPLYIYLTYTVSAMILVPWVLWKRGAGALREEWRINARACVGVGTLNLATYLLVLFAMSLPHTPVSYVVPLRTTSVLFGVLLGVRVLGEERLLPKLAGAVLMMAGIVLMAWKG